jgi:hypothetical protein
LPGPFLRGALYIAGFRHPEIVAAFFCGCERRPGPPKIYRELGWEEVAAPGPGKIAVG